MEWWMKWEKSQQSQTIMPCIGSTCFKKVMKKNAKKHSVYKCVEHNYSYISVLKPCEQGIFAYSFCKWNVLLLRNAVGPW